MISLIQLLFNFFYIRQGTVKSCCLIENAQDTEELLGSLLAKI